VLRKALGFAMSSQIDKHYVKMLLKIPNLFEPNIRTSPEAMNEYGPFGAFGMSKYFVMKHAQK